MRERLSDEELTKLQETWGRSSRTYSRDERTAMPSMLVLLNVVPALTTELIERRAAELRIIRDSELGGLKRMLSIDGHGWLVMHVNDVLAIVDAWLEREADESAERSR